MSDLVSELRQLRYDLACIEGRRKRGTPGRTDAEREPVLRARLAELVAQQPTPPKSEGETYNKWHTPPGFYRDPMGRD